MSDEDDNPALALVVIGLILLVFWKMLSAVVEMADKSK